MTEIRVKSRKGVKASSRRYSCRRCHRQLRACEFEVRLTSKGSQRSKVCRKCRSADKAKPDTPWTAAMDIAVTLRQYPELRKRRLRVIAAVEEAADAASSWKTSLLSADDIVTRAGFGYAVSPIHWHRIMRAVLIRSGEIR